MSVGKGTYSHAGMRRAPHQIFDKIQRKVALRAALAEVSAQIDALVPSLSQVELQELQGLIENDLDSENADVAALQAQVAEETRLSKTTRSMSVVISRKASVILGKEAERRVRRGIYPSSEALIGEAVEKAFGS